MSDFIPSNKAIQYLKYPFGRKLPIPSDKILPLFNSAEQEEIDNWEQKKQKTSRKILSDYRTINKFNNSRKPKSE